MRAGLTARLRLERPAFSLEVALALEPCSVTALVGPSGAGKTTLLRALAGLEPGATGQVSFGDEVWLRSDGWSMPPQARRIGVVFRPPALFPHLSARDNVAFGARDPGCVDGLLARLELESFARRFPQQLSAGEQQRVAIARAFAMAPRLLLLDEPFTALDPALERRLHEAFRLLAAELGVPVLLVTHGLDEAAWLADRLGVMWQGRLLQLGTTREVMQRPTLVEAARVVGVANLFAGQGRNGRIHWQGQELLAPGVPDGPLTWGLRSEHVSLARESSGNNEVVGKVAYAAPSGGQLRVAVGLPGNLMIDALVDSARADALGIVAGAEIRARLPAEHLLVMPPGIGA